MCVAVVWGNSSSEDVLWCILHGYGFIEFQVSSEGSLLHTISGTHNVCVTLLWQRKPCRWWMFSCWLIKKKKDGRGWIQLHVWRHVTGKQFQLQTGQTTTLDVCQEEVTYRHLLNWAKWWKHHIQTPFIYRLCKAQSFTEWLEKSPTTFCTGFPHIFTNEFSKLFHNIPCLYWVSLHCDKAIDN